MYKKIGDYGITGNGLTSAHIGLDGSVDWMCLPYLDSPSIFAAVLDHTKGGRFMIQPLEEWDSTQRYVAKTNILQTLFRTRSGEVEITDFMVACPEAAAHDWTDSLLARRVRGVAGSVELRCDVSPRFQYGRIAPSWHQRSTTWLVARTDEEQLHLLFSEPWEFEDESARFPVEKDAVYWISTVYGTLQDQPEPAVLEHLLNTTEKYWRGWVDLQETGGHAPEGFWKEELDRSALVLKLLQFRRTGAIAAAPSCGLPTIVHGERNWDYRYSWVRDTSMTLQALYETGHVAEVEKYLSWVKEILIDKGCTEIEVLYRLRKPEPPEGEERLEHLHGYKGSQPVVTGQYNVGQHQHDIYGELLDMIFSLSRLVGKIDLEIWHHLHDIVEHVIGIWQEKDNGIWELRTGPHHVTHSKIMCWVALDRGIKIAEHYGFPADLQRWRCQRRNIREDVLKRGYNSRKKSFTQHYQTDELDAALLQIPLVGFLPADDDRVVSTIRAIEEELMIDGLPRRYRVDDGIAGQEHGWLICFFWYLRCRIRLGELDAVEASLRRVGRFANHLGLFGEEFDTRFMEITGNFPQAFSHIGYITTILEYAEARRKPSAVPSLPFREKFLLLFRGRILNPEVRESGNSRERQPGAEVKKVMNILRGQFYDGHKQNIDYPAIATSSYYGDFLHAVADLRHFRPEECSTDAQKIAFWVNVFNTLVIHGVIELRIRASVREVPLFFDRVQYRIGGYLYSLSDIEHGILRGNRRPPYRLSKCFGRNDDRRQLAVGGVDARIHFALVCASRTCPPIDVYTEDQLNDQLDTSAKVFINATTRIDATSATLEVSEIFRWYRQDFGGSNQGVVDCIASHLYADSSRQWLREQGEAVRLVYRPYDWRLNR